MGRLTADQQATVISLLSFAHGVARRLVPHWIYRLSFDDVRSTTELALCESVLRWYSSPVRPIKHCVIYYVDRRLRDLVKGEIVRRKHLSVRNTWPSELWCLPTIDEDGPAMAAFDRLAPAQRDVIGMRVFYEASSRDVAMMRGTSNGSCSSTYFNGIKSMRKNIENRT
jgi:hypothetical protein